MGSSCITLDDCVLFTRAINVSAGDGKDKQAVIFVGKDSFSYLVFDFRNAFVKELILVRTWMAEHFDRKPIYGERLRACASVAALFRCTQSCRAKKGKRECEEQGTGTEHKAYRITDSAWSKAW